MKTNTADRGDHIRCDKIPAVRPEQDIGLIRLARGLATQLGEVCDDERILRRGLREARDFFEADEARIALPAPSPPGSTLHHALPKSGNWDLPLLAAFLRGERPRVPFDTLIAPVKRRRPTWAASHLCALRIASILRSFLWPFRWLRRSTILLVLAVDICALSAAHGTMSPARWMFERRTATDAELIDVTHEVDRACEFTVALQVPPFVVVIRYPAGYAKAAGAMAEHLELGLRALSEIFPSSAKDTVYLDVPIAIEPLPPNCRYVARAGPKRSTGVLVLLQDGTDQAPFSPALLRPTLAALHEVAHHLKPSERFREDGQEWADEGAAEYLALKAMERVSEEFVRLQLEQRAPLDRFLNCDRADLARAFSLRSNRSERLNPTELAASPSRLDLYLGAFLAAERKGFQPLASPGRRPRPAILGVPLPSLLDGVARATNR